MISVKNLCVRLSEKEVLKDFSYTFPEGKITAVSGPSGQGKTTLLRVLCGLQKPDSGSVITERAAVCFQEPRLFPGMTVKENLLFVQKKAERTDELAAHYLSLTELTETADRRADTLSGGQKSRLSLARTLLYARTANAVFLDEPFQGLDPELHEKMRELLYRETRGKTVILITHDPEDAAALQADILRLE